MEEKAQRQDQEKAFEDQQGQINSDLNSFSDDNEVYVKYNYYFILIFRFRILK